MLVIALALLGVGLWAWSGPVLLRKHVLAEVSGPESSDWTVEWTRASTEDRHGTYAELEDYTPAVVEIEVSAHGDAPGEPFDFCLFNIKTDADTALDLVALCDRGNPAAAGWVPVEHGACVVYAGSEIGRLRIPVNTRTVALGYSKTPRGGKATVRFRGEVVELDARSPKSGSDVVVVPGKLRRPPSGELACRLPAYHTSEIAVSWGSPIGESVCFTRPRLVFAVANRPIFARDIDIAAASDVERVDETGWRTTGPRPAVRLSVNDIPGTIVFVVGSSVTCVLLAMTCAVGLIAARTLPLIARWRHTPAIAVAAVVLVVHAAVAAWVPTIVSPDGIEYMDAADHLAQHASFARFSDYKAPGLAVLIAGTMKVSPNFLDTYAWIMAALAVATSVMAYQFARARVPHGWALAAALVVGIHPSLITYETYLLRELPSAAVMMAAALGILRIRDRLADGKGRLWGWAIALALVCAAGAYLRENLQLLIPLVPIAILLPGGGARRPRIMAACVIGVVSAGLVLPWILPIHGAYGNFSVVRPKIQGNRSLAAWSNRTTDANMSEVFSRDMWLSMRNDHLRRPLTDYEFTSLLIRKSKFSTAPAHVSRPGYEGPARSEGMHRSYLKEVASREPVAILASSARAFASQLGLWNFQTGSMKGVAASDEWYSRPLRGEPMASPLNIPHGVLAAVNSVRLVSNKARLEHLVVTNRRSLRFMEDRPITRLFNEWFYTFRACRPVAAVLFLIGVGMAVRRRDTSIAAVGAIVLLSTFGAAFVVGTPTDRFGVPFIPLIWCVAIVAAYQCWSRRERSIRSQMQ